MKKCLNEDGMLVVEATIVFPVMFLVIALMIFLGNLYYQKCRVESYVNEFAVLGAAYCADPMLDDVEAGSIPGFKDVDIQPYRYFFGGMDTIEASIIDGLTDTINNMGTGLFTGMKPTPPSVEVKFNNGFIYSTFSIDVEYIVKIPVKLLGMEDFFSIPLCSHANFPVSDTTEFMRNISMIEDYMQRFGITDKINEMMTKAKEWIKPGK